MTTPDYSAAVGKRFTDSQNNRWQFAGVEDGVFLWHPVYRGFAAANFVTLENSELIVTCMLFPEHHARIEPVKHRWAAIEPRLPLALKIHEEHANAAHAKDPSEKDAENCPLCIDIRRLMSCFDMFNYFNGNDDTSATALNIVIDRLVHKISIHNLIVVVNRRYLGKIGIIND